MTSITPTHERGGHRPPMGSVRVARGALVDGEGACDDRAGRRAARSATLRSAHSASRSNGTVTTRSRTVTRLRGAVASDDNEHHDPEREREPTHRVEVGRRPLDRRASRMSPRRSRSIGNGHERDAVRVHERTREPDAPPRRAATARARPRAVRRRASDRAGAARGTRTRARRCRARSPRARTAPGSTTSGWRPTHAVGHLDDPQQHERGRARRAAAAAPTTACRYRASAATVMTAARTSRSRDEAQREAEREHARCAAPTRPTNSRIPNAPTVRSSAPYSHLGEPRLRDPLGAPARCTRRRRGAGCRGRGCTRRCAGARRTSCRTAARSRRPSRTARRRAVNSVSRPGDDIGGAASTTAGAAVSRQRTSEARARPWASLSPSSKVVDELDHRRARGSRRRSTGRCRTRAGTAS